MNVFLLIAICLILYAFVNYKKAFILFLIFRVFLNQNINILNLPGLPLLTVEFTLCFIFWGLYLILYPKSKIDKSKFPLKYPFIAIIASFFVSSLFGLAGIGNSIFNFLKVLFEDYVSVWLIWVVLKDKKDYVFLIKGISVVFVFAGIYGVLEAITHVNPILDYQISIAGTGEKVLNYYYGDDTIRGYRIRSIFLHPIGAGINFGLYFLIVAYLYVYYRRQIDFRYGLAFWAVFLSVICIFFTNSRGPILFMLIGVIPLFNFKKIRSYVLIFILLISVIGIGIFNNDLFENFISLFDKQAQNNVGGSNLAMRVMQFMAAYDIFQSYPILGIGLKGLSYYPNQTTIRLLLGLESMWLWVIVQQGILGVFITLYLIYTLVFKLGRKERNRPVLFLSLAYFLTHSLTSLPGFLSYLMYAVIFLFIKIQNQWSQKVK